MYICEVEPDITYAPISLDAGTQTIAQDIEVIQRVNGTTKTLAKHSRKSRRELLAEIEVLKTKLRAQAELPVEASLEHEKYRKNHVYSNSTCNLNQAAVADIPKSFDPNGSIIVVMADESVVLTLGPSEPAQEQLTPITPSQCMSPQSELPKFEYVDIEKRLITIGPNNTQVPNNLLEDIDWEKPSCATRDLLMSIFGLRTLFTHTISGSSNYKKLDERIISDIVFLVMKKCNLTKKTVRPIISNKISLIKSTQRMKKPKPRVNIRWSI